MDNRDFANRLKNIRRFLIDLVFDILVQLRFAENMKVKKTKNRFIVTGQNKEGRTVEVTVRLKRRYKRQ